MEKFLYKQCEKKEPKINIWFAYPAIESFAMASLGYLTIFQMLDSDCEIYTERIYSDSKSTFLTKQQVNQLKEFSNIIINVYEYISTAIMIPVILESLQLLNKNL